MDLLSGAALAKQALDNVRSIVELTQKFGDVDLKRRIVDLEDQVAALARERRVLAEGNEGLKRELAIRVKTSFRNPYWYAEGNDVPLCPKCYESSEYKLRIHLTHPARPFNGGNQRHCKNCDQFFYDEGGSPNPSPVSEPVAERYNPLYHGLQMR